MKLARVVGTVVSTINSPIFENRKKSTRYFAKFLYSSLAIRFRARLSLFPPNIVSKFLMIASLSL